MKTFFALCLVLALAGCKKNEAPPPAAPAPPPGANAEAASKTPSRPAVRLPPDLKTKVMLMKGTMLQVLLSGDDWTNLSERDDLVTPFQLKSYRNGVDVQLVGQAPECHVDQVGHRAWDAGPVVLFTPDSNVWVKGQGFLFVETNHSLIISNNVETRVLRSLIKTAGSGAARTNGQVLKIFADRCFFDYQSNLARYFGHVHAMDPQLDLRSEKLSIQMTTNSTIQTILAENDVVLTTTNKGWAAGPRAYYYVTNGSEMTEMTGGVVWHNGGEKAQAEQFVYDSTNHLLTGAGHVLVWWPNAPAKAGAVPKVDQRGYRELSSDFATLQWPPTNGPVEAMHATGHVVITNQADQSEAIGEQADYTRTNGLFILSGQPKWWNNKMEIRGLTLTLTTEGSNQVYRSRNGSHLKLEAGSATHSNQWLYIDSQQLDYRTNLAVFTDHVKTALYESNVLRDTLFSDKLDVELFSNEVKTAVARGHVRGKSAPDVLGRVKTIDCDVLTAHRNPVTKLLTEIVAQDHVTLRQFGTNAAMPRDTLKAKMVTAYFSSVLSNRLERAVAEQDVVIDQIKTNQPIHATGQRGVYTAASDEFMLTGAPFARTDRQLLLNAAYMIWQPKTNRFRAFGPYTVVPLKFQTTKK